MLTGRLPIRTGVYTNLSYPLDLIYRVFLPSSVGCMPQQEVTIADHLGAAGYYTALIGKWHLGTLLFRRLGLVPGLMLEPLLSVSSTATPGHNPANNCTPNDQVRTRPGTAPPPTSPTRVVGRGAHVTTRFYTRAHTRSCRAGFRLLSGAAVLA